MQLNFASTLAALQWERIVHVFQVVLFSVSFVVSGRDVELISQAHVDVLLRYVENGQRTKVCLSVLVLDCYFIGKTWLTCLHKRFRLCILFYFCLL